MLEINDSLFHVLRRRLHSHSAWDRTLVILHCAVAHGLSDLTFLVDVGALFYQLATIVLGFASWTQTSFSIPRLTGQIQH